MAGGYSRLELINMALDRVGARAITSDTDTSTEARTAVRHYAYVLKRLMMRYPWNWATVRKTKAPEAATPVNISFGYEYQLDGDYMRLNYLTIPGYGYPHNPEPIEFAIEQDKLYTDVSPILMGYVSTTFLERPDQMHAGFADALVYALAASMSTKFLDKASAFDTLRKEAERAYMEGCYYDSVHGSPQVLADSAAYRARMGDGRFFSDYRLSTARINL